MKCLICRHDINEGDLYCGFCGARIENSEEDSIYQSFADYDEYRPTVSLTRLNTGEKFEITEYPCIIGRSSQCDILISGNKAISRKHLEINRVGYTIIIKDLGSRNHTYINLKRVNDVHIVKGTERMILADEEFIIEVNDY